MKISLRRMVATAILATAMSTAQAEPARRQASSNESQLQIVDTETGKTMDCDSPFRSGQKFRLRLAPETRGYVYLVNVAPSGQRTQVFPILDEVNLFEAGALEIPSPGQPPFEFDHESGTEIIEVTISQEPIQKYEVARRSPSFKERTTSSIGSSVGDLIWEEAQGLRLRQGVTMFQAKLRHD